MSMDETAPSSAGSHNPKLPPASTGYRRGLFLGREISVYCDHQRPTTIQEHQHDGDVQVMMVFEPGGCVLSADGNSGFRPHKLVGPQVALIASKVPHACRWEQEGDLLVLYVWEPLWRDLTKANLPGVVAGEALVTVDRDFVLWKLAGTLRDLCDERNSPDLESIEGVARELVRRLGGRLRDPVPPQTKPRGPVLSAGQLRKVDDFLKAHLAHDIHVADIERCLGLSSTQVTELFKNSVNLTPYEYIKQRRMLKALELLRTGEHRLYEVAAMVGYQDAGYFSSEFKKWTGVASRTVLENARLRTGKSHGSS